MDRSGKKGERGRHGTWEGVVRRGEWGGTEHGQEW